MKKLFNKNLYKLFTGIISFSIILALYRNVNTVQIKNILNESNFTILIISLLISIFLGIIGGWRYYYCAKLFKFKKFPGFYTSTKSYFISSLFNLLVPSKIGDLGKGFICNFLDRYKYGNNIHIYTIYEKLSDLFSILFLGVLINFILRFNFSNTIYHQNIDNLSQGSINLNFLYLLIFVVAFFILFPFQRISNRLIYLKKNKINFLQNFLKIIFKFNIFKSKLKIYGFIRYQSISITIWLIHIFQICLFAEALEINLWSYSGIFIIITTILFGLIPISFAGIGTREALLVYLLSPIYGNTKPLILGVFMILRYIIPAIVGAFFFKNIHFKIKENKSYFE